MAQPPSAQLEAIVERDSPYDYPEKTAVDLGKQIQPFAGTNPEPGGTGTEG